MPTATFIAVLSLAALILWLSRRSLTRQAEIETRLTKKIDLLGDDLTAGLLNLRNDAVTRISDIQQQPAQMVRATGPVPGSPRLKREVTLIFMDQDECHEIGRVVIYPLRRAQRTTYAGQSYVCARGSVESGAFIYRA